MTDKLSLRRRRLSCAMSHMLTRVLTFLHSADNPKLAEPSAMPILISFRRHSYVAPTVVLGPFARVEMPYRRLLGDGRLVAVLQSDGRWRVGDEMLLDVRIERSDGLPVIVTLERPWDGGRAETRTLKRVRLFGDGMLNAAGREVAVAVSDSRAWIDGSGRVFDLACAA